MLAPMREETPTTIVDSAHHLNSGRRAWSMMCRPTFWKRTCRLWSHDEVRHAAQSMVLFHLRPTAAAAMSEDVQEAKQKGQRETSNDFQFITFTDLQQTTDPETKKKVRSHVMHRVQRNMKGGNRPGKHREIVLDTSSLVSESSTGHRAPALLPTMSESGQDLGNTISLPVAVPNLNTLGAGRANPFVSYPIHMNVRTHELFDHLHGDYCPMFRTLSKIGFFGTITDPAGFYQILCTSTSHMTKLREGTENSEAIALSTQAIQSINSRLADPVLSISDGVVGTILAFCCHAVMFNDLNGSLTHLNGLEEIIRRRGGLNSLYANPAMRMVLFWVDVNIAFIHDSCPRFRPPDDLLPKIDTPHYVGIPFIKISEMCPREDITLAMKELCGLNQLITNEIETRNLWLDGVFAGLHIIPVLHKLLTTSYDDVGYDHILRRLEAYRLGAILYLGTIRCEFGVNLPTGVLIRKLRQTMVFLEDRNIQEKPPVLLWMLLIGGINSFLKEEHESFVSKMAQVIINVGAVSWEELMTHVRAVLWIEGLSVGGCDGFRGEISARVLDSYGHIFV